VVSDRKSDIFLHCSLYTLLVFACMCASMKSHMRNSIRCVVPAFENCETIQQVICYSHVSADRSVWIALVEVGALCLFQ
jgi:hypothetical protein